MFHGKKFQTFEMFKTLAISAVLCSGYDYHVDTLGEHPWQLHHSPSSFTVTRSANAHFGGMTSVSTGANEPNEDRITGFRAEVRDLNGDLVHDIDVMGVFDGHGGYFVSEYVSTKFPEVFSDFLGRTTNVTQALLSTFQTLESSVRDLLLHDRFVQATLGDRRFNIGACGLVVVVTKDGIISANVGDSRALAVTNDLHYFRLNREHNSGRPDEQAALRKRFPRDKDILQCFSEHVCYVKGMLQPTRSFGDLSLKERIPGLTFTQMRSYTPPYISAVPEILSFSKENVKYIVLGSDGVWEQISDDNMGKVLDWANGDANGVKDVALQHAWNHAHITEDEYRHLPGQDRRQIVDDLSVVVLEMK